MGIYWHLQHRGDQFCCSEIPIIDTVFSRSAQGCQAILLRVSGSYAVLACLFHRGNCRVLTRPHVVCRVPSAAVSRTGRSPARVCSSAGDATAVSPSAELWTTAHVPARSKASWRCRQRCYLFDCLVSITAFAVAWTSSRLHQSWVWHGHSIQVDCCSDCAVGASNF